MKPSLKILMVTGAAALLFPVLFPATASAVRPAVDTATLEQAVATRSVRRGDRSEAVAVLQRLLKAADIDPGPIDGIFGPLTEAAVRKAQAAVGVTVDGVATRQTVQGLLLKVTADPGPAAQPAPAPADGLVLHDARTPVPPAAAVPAMAAPQQAQAPARTEGDAPQPAAAPAGEKAAAATSFALTFNGLPAPTRLAAVLATLARHQMQATFFVSGEEAAAAPEAVWKLAKAGHEVGNAGYGAFDMTRVTRAMMSAQIAQAQQVLKAVGGKAPQYFRPPQAHWTQDLLRSATESGLQSVLWSNVSAPDLAGMKPDALQASLADAAYPGAVLMLHADRASTLDALDQILGGLEGKGYRSLTLSGLAAATGQSNFDITLR